MAYEATFGSYPNDSHNLLPPGMDEFMDASAWPKPTPLGGWYNWDGPDFYPYAGIALYGVGPGIPGIITVDKILDNGNIATGSFRLTGNGRLTYILDE